MEPGTFEDDEDRRTERTMIGAELTGRVNGLRLLIMRGRDCADCEKGCDRKRRDGRTAHPNCPFNPLLASLADMQCGIGRLAEQRIARRLVGSYAEPTFSHEGCDGRVNPSTLTESGD